MPVSLRWILSATQKLGTPCFSITPSTTSRSTPCTKHPTSSAPIAARGITRCKTCECGRSLVMEEAAGISLDLFVVTIAGAPWARPLLFNAAEHSWSAPTFPFAASSSPPWHLPRRVRSWLCRLCEITTTNNKVEIPPAPFSIYIGGPFPLEWTSRPAELPTPLHAHQTRKSRTAPCSPTFTATPPTVATACISGGWDRDGFLLKCAGEFLLLDPTSPTRSQRSTRSRTSPTSA